jgi:hypothetical protein
MQYSITHNVPLEFETLDIILVNCWCHFALAEYIPSGLQIGDKVLWISETQPERAIVRWIGKIREELYAGIEFVRHTS